MLSPTTKLAHKKQWAHSRKGFTMVTKPSYSAQDRFLASLPSAEECDYDGMVLMREEDVLTESEAKIILRALELLAARDEFMYTGKYASYPDKEAGYNKLRTKIRKAI